MTAVAALGKRNPYAVLGVALTASPAEITTAYRELVRDLHPDAHPHQPVRGEQLDEVVAAYATLRDPQRRAAYDAQHTRGTHAPAPPPRHTRAERRYSAGDAGIVVALGVRLRLPRPKVPLWAGPVRVERPR
ncbi:J domain-containing protein [Streptomyces sp. NPDC052236]|uniref:J domain-containing protein n=1 Tax=Streptomyces sp. NPDC052236 TaxID=3365686 RepID=UPI0037D4E2BE